MTLKTAKKTLQVEDVPEVLQFVNAQAELHLFIKRNQKVIEQYADLAERYNNELEAADKSLRALCDSRAEGISCGPFEFKHFATKYNGDALLSELGNDPKKFQLFGGTVKTIEVNEVDKQMIESLIERGDVSPALQRAFVKRAANYDKPKKMVVLP